MSRFLLTRASEDPADLSNPPVEAHPPDADKVVPDSFAEWLAQPAQTITDGMDIEQGIFAGLMMECQLRMDGNHPVQARRH